MALNHCIRWSREKKMSCHKYKKKKIKLGNLSTSSFLYSLTDACHSGDSCGFRIGKTITKLNEICKLL